MILNRLFRKNLVLLISFIINCSAVFAETVTVQALEDFSTTNPPKFLTVKLFNDIQLDENLILKNGNLITGKIIDIDKPKRLKRDAKFTFQLIRVEDSSGNYFHITNYYTATYTTKLNSGNMVKSAALTVGNHFVKGMSLGYYAVEGVVKNEEGNRLKSSATALYKNSPVSYVEKGEEVNIKNGEIFYLKFKTYKTKDKNSKNQES